MTGGGPVIIDECQTNSDGWTVCQQAKGESHGTLTPSGNSTTQVNFQFACYSVTDPLGHLIYRHCDYDEHFADHINKDGQSVFHWAYDELVTTGGQTCSAVVRNHFANGQYQYTDAEVECS